MTASVSKLSSKSLLSAIALTAIAGLALMGQSSAASAKSVLSCEGGSKRSVIECCETMVQRKGLPMWMKQAGGSCSSAAVCKPGGGRTPLTHAAAPKRKCWIAMQYPQHRSNGGKTHDGGQGQGSQTSGGIK